MRLSRFLLAAIAATAGKGNLQAEFLFAPTQPTPNGLYTPTLDYENMTIEYSAWDIFYAPRGAGNYPDIFAPFGGVEIAPGVWAPETRTSAGFPTNPNYNPANPLAFWDTRNATITQTLSNTTFIVGPDISGNIYTFQDKTGYSLKNNPDYGSDGVGTVLFQFQTDGSTVDFSSIKLIYYDANHQVLGEISALDAEYLREYKSSSGAHWSAGAGYANRVALQWDTSDLTDAFGNHISDYEIVWTSNSSSMSFQKADLVTANAYQAGIPISASWQGGNGLWSNNSQWALHAASGLTAPQENGNIKFANTTTAAVSLDGSHTVGELIFESANNVTINSVGGAALTANTGATTRAGATGLYTVNADLHLGAVNFFEINDGTVRMNGVISGNEGIVKTGAGTLILANNNTFTGFLGVQDGTVRVLGTNTYGGSTAVVNGTLVVAQNAGATGALGSNSNAIALGGDESLYHYTTGIQTWMAGLMIDGNYTISRDIALAPGNLGKRLGAMNAAGGATFSGTITFTNASADPDAVGNAAGNVKLTAQAAADRVIFSGAMTGGATAQTVTIDGLGTIVYAGANKTYFNATVIERGRLEIVAGTALSGNGAMTVQNGGELVVQGTLSGSGALVLEGGKLSGTGTITRGLTVDAGDTLAPGSGVGSLQTGAEIWGGGGKFSLELTNTQALAGAGWDVVNISGTLDLQATSAARFTLQLSTLAVGGAAGVMQNFNAANNYAWTFAIASGGISGFEASKFDIDAGGFLNAIGGSFQVSNVGNTLVLNYLAVPEPGSAALLGGGLLIGGLRRWRRR